MISCFSETFGMWAKPILGFVVGCLTGSMIYLLRSWILNREERNSIWRSQVKGETLDRFGSYAGLEREKRESDRRYRARILEKLRGPL